MKRVILLLTIFVAYAFGYNYTGTWINKSESSYNDPVKLEIKGTTVRPVIKRGSKVVALKSKKATKVGNELFEAWGFGSKNLVLYIKPINSNKIRVTEKKIYTNKKVVYTKTFIFTKKAAPISIRKRFVGNYRSSGAFSAISRVSIQNIDGKIFVRAWKRHNGRVKPLGSARAKLYNNKLHIIWKRKNLVVNATIKGYNYNSRINRYKNLELDVRAKNLKNGLTNRQTMQLRRGSVKVPPRPIATPRANHPRPIYKKIKIGPVDLNLMINSY